MRLSAADYARDLGLPVTECQIRVSRRARQAYLKVVGEGMVEAVLPRGWAKTIVQDMLQEHRQWLHTQLHLITEKTRNNPLRYQALPDRLELLAINQNWDVSYQATEKRASVKERVSDNGCELLLFSSDDAGRKRLLQNWIARKAQKHLLPWFDYTSEKTGLCYRQLTLRSQKTRWGSCSREANINLNRSLLFIPADLVTYVMVHELCHTLHPNHSKRFWDLVGSYIPNYLDLDRQLDDACEIPPLWLFSKQE